MIYRKAYRTTWITVVLICLSATAILLAQAYAYYKNNTSSQVLSGEMIPNIIWIIFSKAFKEPF